MIIGVGGGITGDVTGFVASIFKRGINFINIPTTLLAQVDLNWWKNWSKFKLWKKFNWIVLSTKISFKLIHYF